MIRFVLTFWLLLASVCGYTQELVNFYAEPDGPEAVTLHTTVFYHSVTTFEDSQISIEGNQITLSLCYQNTVLQVQTFDQQSFSVNLPAGFSEYSFVAKLYGDVDGPPCTLSNQVDDQGFAIQLPYNPTATTYVPDDVFEDYLEDIGAGDDVPENDLVFTHRINQMTYLFLNNQFILLSGDINSMQGLEAFGQLRALWCSNNEITQIDLSQNPLLEELGCWGNPIASLDLTNNSLLWFLMCHGISITSLDLSNNTELEWLDASYNALNQVDLSANVELRYLRLSDCGLNELEISQNSMLEHIDVTNNNLTTVDFSNNSLLELISAGQNSLIELDVSNLSDLIGLGASNNDFTTLDLSGNPNIEFLNLVQSNLITLNLKNGQNELITHMVTQASWDLLCIDVDDPIAAPYPGWNVDSHTGFSADCSLGLTVLEKEAIWLHPNPVQTVAYLQSPYAVETIKLYAIGGNLVREFYSTRLEMDNLKAGIYFAKVHTTEGTATVKVVKQ